MNEERCRLYLITPNTLDPEAFVPLLDRTLAAGDVAALQVRLKSASDDELRHTVKTLKPVAHAHEVALIVNDRPDIAADLDADGVHIGQDDVPYDEARKIVGPHRIVGVTCHNSRHLAMTAGEAGADYVAFGAFYPTGTKEVKFQASPEILTWWSELFTVPCVAIGGITAANAAPLVRAGADFLAVSGGVWNNPAGPEEAVREINAVIAETAAFALTGSS